MSRINDQLIERYLNIVDNYFSTMQVSLSSLNRILELYLEGVQNEGERQYELERNTQSSVRRRRNLRSRGRTVRSFNMSPVQETPVFNFGNRTRTSAPNLFGNPDPIQYRSTRIINPFAERNTRMSNFINATLNNVYNRPTPASQEAISNHTTEYSFSEISNETTQERCPISLTQFDASSSILRINDCGHIFDRASLIRWFGLNTRCPICRFNIDPNSTINNRTNSTQTNTTAGAGAGAAAGAGAGSSSGAGARVVYNTTGETTFNNSQGERVGIFDISFTIPNFLPVSSTDPSNNDIDELVENVSTVLTEGINNMFNTTINRTDNSGNGIFL